MSQTTASYSDCVANLRTSLGFLESSVNTLSNGVSDFPRLISVLKSVRHYELIPTATLSLAEASLRDEISPFTTLLLARAESQLERQARRIETLKARSELNAGRLSSAPGDGAASQSRNGGGRHGGAGAARKLDGEAALRARVLRQRKEALKYSVERLEMEVAQKERELRIRLERD
ncbi:putative DASH complex protein [Coniochaeta sp. 2T2.1]|nr:putative DASH complex protein [Coniochaeta sp. 2T2.1]